MAVTAGDQRVVSVLVADVVGSTTIAERLGPERTKFLFDEVLRLMSATVREYEGTVAQLTGDGLLALFGAPVAHEDDAERAVRAGLGLREAVEQYAREVEAAYGVPLDVRVGINTGPIVVPRLGEGGDDERYNALGDTVNVAARLQSAGDGGRVVVGPATASQVRTCFELESLGALELKGKSAAVEAFEVLGRRDEPSPHDDRPIVGRDFELAVLERAMDGLVEGTGAIVSIVGEPGIGKTRLAAEVCRRYAGRIRFVEGRAVAYAQSFPYWPIRELLREWLGVAASTPDARVRLELKTQLARLLGDAADAAYPFLAGPLGVTLEPDAAARIRELNREALQRRTFDTVRDLIARIAAEDPLCLVLEDLHWADESTLELLEELLGAVEEGSLGLLLLYRTEREHPSWRLGERARQRYPHRYREIELRPLAPDASRALATERAQGALPPTVVELLTERAGGNPFFLEEALRDLVERGALARENGGWRLAVDADALAVPAVVQGALQARLDRLDPETRQVVSVAAVAGRTFTLPLLERLVPHDPLLRSLTELQRLDLIVEKRRRPAPEYRFRHGLVQEVAYASLLEPTRTKLHSRVGEALEELYGDRAEVSALLARHFSEAGDAAKAADYLLAAGDEARALYADEEAVAHYRRARRFLAELGDEERERTTLFKIALARHLAFDFRGAEEAYDAAFCCRVGEPEAAPPRTERLRMAVGRPDAVVPGDAYTTEGAAVVEQLFRGLLRVDADLNVVPEIADNMRVSSDGLTYLFQIRESARWSDGEPVTADDFVNGWRFMREQNRTTAFLLEDVESAEALDDWTLEVRLREPRNYFPYVLASHWSYPWPSHRCEELGDGWRDPEGLVSNGPFVLAELGPEGALLRANPHWSGARGNVGEVELVFTRSRAHSIERFREGGFDIMPAWRQVGDDARDLAVESTPAFTTNYIGFDASRPPFSSELVRRAFAHATDRSLVDPMTTARPANLGGMLPPALPGHRDDVALPYDLELATRLLADAGYPAGRGLPEIEVVIPDYLDGARIAEAWGRLGARVVVRAQKGGTIDQKTSYPASHAFFAGWTADYPDPDGFFRGLLAGHSWPFSRDAQLLDLLEQARSSRDQDERVRLYEEIDRVWVAERAAVVPMAYGRSLLVRRPWVTGIRTNPMSFLALDDIVVERPDDEASERGDAAPATVAP